VHTFAWSTATAILFSATFGAGLLAIIFWLQDVWGYSAIKTGLAIAPGPLMVPLFAISGQALTKRAPSHALVVVGSLLWGVGTLMMLLSLDATPSYASAVLPGWLVCGVGMGLAMPTILSSATAQLPPSRSATGSAIVNMARHIGTVLGISLLIATLGTSADFEAQHRAFRLAWWLVIAIAALSAVAATRIAPRAQRQSD
jgi:hypothetical protein